MDIKRMHCMIEKIAECAESEFNKGIENVDPVEMGQVTDMLKDLAEAMYYRTLTKAMDESETDEIMEMFDRYGDGGRRFYDNYRYANGRFAPKGRGTRRGYEEMPYWHMTPEMYHDWTDGRDMDRDRIGRMYYSEPSRISDSAMRDSREGRSGMSRKSYMESKELHRANTPQDKEAKMRELEKYMKELGEDITEMLMDMTPEERSMAKSKLATLVSKM